MSNCPLPDQHPYCSGRQLGKTPGGYCPENDKDCNQKFHCPLTAEHPDCSGRQLDRKTQRDYCPKNDKACRRSFPGRIFKQELEYWSNHSLQPLLNALNSDEELVSIVNQLKADINSIIE